MKKTIYEENYIPDSDKTIIFKTIKNGRKYTETIIGWYYGAPDCNTTQEYIKHNNIVARYEL